MNIAGEKTDMNVRLAASEDLQRVNELRRQVNEMHVQGRPDFFRPGFSEELQQYLYTLHASADHDVLVAEGNNGAIVGFACVKYVDRPESPYRLPCRFLEIEEIGVDEGCRRSGAGRALVEAARRIAREKGFPRIDLNMWSFNENALAFYESVGFTTYRQYMEMPVD